VKTQIIRNGFRVTHLAAILLMAPPLCAHAHEEPVHQEITRSAFRSADGIQTFLSETLPVGNSPFTGAPLLTASLAPAHSPDSPMGWLVWGAYMEDNDDEAVLGRHFLRSSDHFYTLLRTSKQLTDETEGDLPNNRTDSFTWATTPGMAGPFGYGSSTGPNSQTWQDARAKQTDTLTLPNKSDREAALALSLYALGHVLHLNQDLSQPDHVRNDEHPSWTVATPHGKHWIEDYGLHKYLEASQKAGTLGQTFPLRARGWQSWRMAGFQTLKDFWDRGKYTGLSSTALNNDLAATWPPQSPPTVNQLGLAEFSNGNFLGEDATYGDLIPSSTPPSLQFTLHHFPYPSLWTSTLFKQWLSSAAGAAPVTFRNNMVGDRLYIYKNAEGQHVIKHAALTHAAAQASKTVTLATLKELVTIHDDNVLQEYHSILIPKAIEYSAGILDYFFRGNLNVTPTLNCDAETYNLNIKNQSGQTMKGGTFQLFYDDVSGDRHLMDSIHFIINWTDTSGSRIDDGQSTNATVYPITGAVKYILVYKGTIGITNGTYAALDSVDSGIAIAAKSFTLGLCPDVTATKWQNVTKVTDYHLNGAGSPINGSGIAPYTRNAPDYLVPGCGVGGDCSHGAPSSNPECLSWRSFANSTMPPGYAESPPFGPNNLKDCTGAGVQQIDFNCYAPLTTTITANRRCAEGFKNLQARKQWHGVFGFTSEQWQAANSVTFDGTTFRQCQPERMAADQTKYRTITGNFSRTLNAPIPPATSSCTISVGQKTGVISLDSISINDSMNADGRTPLLSFDLRSLADENVATISGRFFSILKNYFSDSTLTMNVGGSSYTFVYNSTASADLQGKTAAVITTDWSSSFDLVVYGLFGPYPGTWQQVETIHFGISSTTLDYTLWTINGFPPIGWTPNSVVGHPAQTDHATITLSNPYTANDAYQDAKALLDANYWNLDDDIVYPWRGDGFLNIAPMLTYAEIPQNILPRLKQISDSGTVDDYSRPQVNGITPQRPWFDINASRWFYPSGGTYPSSLATLVGPFYDGSVLGKPGKPGDKAFSWDHNIWAVCIDPDTLEQQLYIKGYGAHPGDDGVPVPDTTTHWTELLEAVSLPGDGNFVRQIPGGAIYIQQFIQLDAATTAQNWSRPCSSDASLMDETTVQCVTGVSGGTGSRTFTLRDVPVGIANGNQIVVTGDGYYTVTSVSGNSVTASRTGDLPAGFTYLNDTSPVLGKRRFPSAPATCDPAWDNTTRKGNFAVLTWGFNYRDFAERQRTIATGCPPGGGQIRYNQYNYHGMPQEVNSLSIDQRQCSGDVPNSPCGRILKPLDLPGTFSGDERFGARWQSIVQNVMQELYWQAPHKKCEFYDEDEYPFGVVWAEAPIGQCIEDYVDPKSFALHAFYPNRPWVECVVTKPAGSPALPTWIYVGYLSLADLDTPNSVVGNIAMPLDTKMANEYLAGSISDERWIPWAVLMNKRGCIESGGRFSAQYTAQGVKLCQ